MSEAQSPPAGETETVDERTTCPTCYKPHDTRRALKIHHKRLHDERLVDYKECEECGNEFEPHRPGKGQKYCSRECVVASQTRAVELTCPECGETFESPPCEADRRTFCSRACQTASKRETLECEECGDAFEVRSHRAETARYCSWDCRTATTSTITRECPVCYKTLTVYQTEYQRGRGQYCSVRCRCIDRKRTGQYLPRNSADPETRFERLVDHSFIKEGHSIDATTRIVHERLPNGERWTRDDVEELTAEILTRQRKVDRRLEALRPEDLGLTPLGGKR